jgi:ATP-binding cassette subfamily C protein CydD
MRPFDPRLLRRAPATRRHLAVLGVLGALTGAVVVVQAATLAAVLAAAAGYGGADSGGDPGGGVDGRLDRVALAGFVAAVATRAALLWGQGVVAARAAATVKAALRTDLLAAVGRRGPGWLSGQHTGSLATLAGRGLDALDAYFTGYLPQLVLAVTVPLAVLARMVFADWSSAVIVAVTLPLIPIFGALLGWQAQAATERQWRRLAHLGGHFLDMVAGLPTLRAFGRARGQVATVRRMADGHRVATMRTLRIAFLSSLVLELIATLSVALVAVPIGIRLLGGGLPLETALLILLLAPEAYLPLRAAGARFHASMEGLTALDESFRLLDEAGLGRVERPASEAPAGAAARVAERLPDPTRDEIVFDGVTVAYARVTALCEVSLTVRPGERIAVIGPSGAGKSTLLGLLLGFVVPTAGRVLVGGADLSALDLDAWRRRIAWVPQRAHLFADTLAGNIRLGASDAPDAAVEEAVRAAALTEVVAALPEGLDTPLGERGQGLSSGQRQRVALARAFLRDAPLLLLDEPTARLDGASEAAVLTATRRLVAGRTALLVAHRPALLSAADRIVRVTDGRLAVLERPANQDRPPAAVGPS